MSNSFESLPSVEVEKRSNVVFDSMEKRERIVARSLEIVDDIAARNSKIIVFPDRSARPISWMIREAWKARFPDEAAPKMLFVNIGREKVAWADGYLPGMSGHKLWSSDEEFFEDFDDEFNVGPYLKAIQGSIDALDEEAENMEARAELTDENEPHLLVLDDFANTNLSVGLTMAFFRHHFPNIEVKHDIFFENVDDRIFAKKGWDGAFMPWYEDKSYTLLSEEDGEFIAEDTTVPSGTTTAITAEVERDVERRKKGLDLKREIRELFAGVHVSSI